MKLEHSVQVAIRFALSRIRQEYAALNGHVVFSLRELFDHDQFSLDQYCASYRPHPHTAQLVDIVQEFGERYGIWLPNARHYVTSALFLFPDADPDRATALVKNLATDYYLNDTIGRDIFRYLDDERQADARQLIQRMTSIDETLQTVPQAQGIELANAEMLREIRDCAPLSWFVEFLQLYSYHIEVTHRDNSAAALGYLPTVDEYISIRNHTSGMPHIISLAEFSDNRFLNWKWLTEMKLDASMRRIHRACALFGCLTNDLFSFEKEVIDNKADCNLVMAIAVNNPEWSFEEAIAHAASIVRNVLKDFLALTALLHEKMRQLSNPGQAEIVETHLGTLEKIVQASWMWQVFTKRYKRPLSIWKETTLADERATASA